MEDENPTLERKPRRHITLKEQLGLSEYIKVNHGSWMAAALTQVQILDKCRAYLGWELNINTMRDIFRAMEIALPQRQAADPVKKSEHVQILADCMADLYRQLGQPLPSKLAQMLGGAVSLPRGLECCWKCHGVGKLGWSASGTECWECSGTGITIKRWTRSKEQSHEPQTTRPPDA